VTVEKLNSISGSTYLESLNGNFFKPGISKSWMRAGRSKLRYLMLGREKKI